MTIDEALDRALRMLTPPRELLESLGYHGRDLCRDLAAVRKKLQAQYPQASREPLDD